MHPIAGEVVSTSATLTTPSNATAPSVAILKAPAQLSMLKFIDNTTAVNFTVSRSR